MGKRKNFSIKTNSKDIERLVHQTVNGGNKFSIRNYDYITLPIPEVHGKWKCSLCGNEQLGESSDDPTQPASCNKCVSLYIYMKKTRVGNFGGVARFKDGQLITKESSLPEENKELYEKTLIAGLSRRKKRKVHLVNDFDLTCLVTAEELLEFPDITEVFEESLTVEWSFRDLWKRCNDINNTFGFISGYHTAHLLTRKDVKFLKRHGLLKEYKKLFLIVQQNWLVMLTGQQQTISVRNTHR